MRIGFSNLSGHRALLLADLKYLFHQMLYQHAALYICRSLSDNLELVKKAHRE